MKKYIISSLVLLAVVPTNAQVAIGKVNINGNSTLLDFYDNTDNFRGIILPALEVQPSSFTPANNGTFLFDKSDKKIKMYENNVWKSLSETGDDSGISNNTTTESENNQGVIIGSDTSAAKGILVLESAGKAMILPKVANPHLTVKSPYPGMICYDTVSKTLAVFDGKVWNYWK